MFIFRTAFRYAFSKTNGHRVTSIIIIIGIAASVMAVIVSASVMNSLQNTQLDHLRDIESFDLIVKGCTDAGKLESTEGVDGVYRFTESAAVIENKDSGISTSCRIRGVEESYFDCERLKNSLVIVSGDFPEDNGIVVSHNVRNAILLLPEDEIVITVLKKGKTARIVPYKFRSKSCGIYSSALQEFDSSTVFINIDYLENIINNDYILYGIYVNDDVNTVAAEIASYDSGITVQTWQEYNRALFSALMLEKTMMYVFLGFMFLIVCVNLKNSTMRLIKSKLSEGAILRAIGCTKTNTIFIFIVQGIAVSVIGIIAGVCAGLIIINNIGPILSVVDRVSVLLTKNPSVFSHLRINAEITFKEIIFICSFVLVLSLLFTFSACRKLYRKEILEVLYYVSD